MPLEAGIRLGTYEIVGPLGTGGMGEVYRASDLRLGREVALKVLPADVATNPARLARFEREARTVAGLNHPNIVALYSVEDEGTTRFLTMELVEGQGLDRHVTSGGLPVERVLDVGIGLSDALTAAHERGVVHRDLKPANVMLTREGCVKVLDFGLARVERQKTDVPESQASTISPPLSGVGQVVGTVPYMAPEQVRGEPADARSDLFALGTILYELAAGRRPFDGATPADVSAAILRDTPPALAGVRMDLPADLVRIVDRCLAKHPRARFQTALDVCNELRQLKQALEHRGVAMAGPGDFASIAVLPFVNRSRDEDDEYFAEGLADETLSLLAKIRGLRVAARSSSSTFKGRAVTVADVGRALNVATVLEGSVRKAGTRVRIAVQLVKVADGYHLWSETYDRTLEDIFAVQDDIAHAVVKELRSTLLGEVADARTSSDVMAEVAAAAKGRGADPEAHRLFIHGRYLINRTTPADIARGIEHLHHALAIDPGHALAWAWLSWAESQRANHGLAPVDEAAARAREAAQRALAIEPNLAEAHLALGMTRLIHDFDWQGAEASMGRALELAPDSAEVLHGAGLMEYCLGRPDRSLELCRRAVDQDPLHAGSYDGLGRAYRVLKRFGEAEAAFRRALEIAPDYSPGHTLLAATLIAQGRYDEALDEALREKSKWVRLCTIAMVQHSRGCALESDAALKELTEGGSDDFAYQIACVHAHRGDADATFEWLERCYVQHDSGLALLAASPSFERMREDPRWPRLMRRIGRT